MEPLGKRSTDSSDTWIDKVKGLVRTLAIDAGNAARARAPIHVVQDVQKGATGAAINWVSGQNCAFGPHQDCS